MFLISILLPDIFQQCVCNCLTPSEENDDGELARKAEEFFDRSEFSKAIRCWNDAISVNPDDPDYYINRGIAFQELGEFRNAQIDFTKALSFRPHRHIFFNRGNTYFDLGEYELGIEDFTQALDFDLDDYESFFFRGLGYSKIGGPENLEKAIRDFSSVIRLNKRFSKAYINRGQSYVSLGKFDLAIRDYTTALKVGKERSGVIYGLRGYAYYKKKDFQKAADDYIRKKNMDPEYEGPTFDKNLMKMFNKRRV